MKVSFDDFERKKTDLFDSEEILQITETEDSNKHNCR